MARLNLENLPNLERRPELRTYKEYRAVSNTQRILFPMESMKRSMKQAISRRLKAEM